MDFEPDKENIIAEESCQLLDGTGNVKKTLANPSF